MQIQRLAHRVNLQVSEIGKTYREEDEQNQHRAEDIPQPCVADHTRRLPTEAAAAALS